MSISTKQPSPQELLAGIKAVAAYIGPQCALNARIAMLGEAAAAVATDPNQILASDMTLRDHFAERSLQSLITGRVWGHVDKSVLLETWAKSAYGLADAMLAARNHADSREQLIAALAEMLDQHENGIVGINKPCAERARAALAAAGAA